MGKSNTRTGVENFMRAIGLPIVGPGNPFDPFRNSGGGFNPLTPGGLLHPTGDLFSGIRGVGQSFGRMFDGNRETGFWNNPNAPWNWNDASMHAPLHLHPALGPVNIDPYAVEDGIFSSGNEGVAGAGGMGGGGGGAGGMGGGGGGAWGGGSGGGGWSHYGGVGGAERHARRRAYLAQS